MGPRPGGDEDGIDPGLRSLVQAYVAYLSGCDRCTLDALRRARTGDADGSRLHLLPAWRRAPARTYTDRERIALVWTEVVALVGEEGMGEPLRRQAAELFRPTELAALTRAVSGTRGWTRLLRARLRSGARAAEPSGSRAACQPCAAA